MGLKGWPASCVMMSPPALVDFLMNRLFNIIFRLDLALGISCCSHLEGCLALGIVILEISKSGAKGGAALLKIVEVIPCATSHSISQSLLLSHSSKVRRVHHIWEWCEPTAPAYIALWSGHHLHARLPLVAYLHRLIIRHYWSLFLSCRLNSSSAVVWIYRFRMVDHYTRFLFLKVLLFHAPLPLIHLIQVPMVTAALLLNLSAIAIKLWACEHWAARLLSAPCGLVRGVLTALLCERDLGGLGKWGCHGGGLLLLLSLLRGFERDLLMDDIELTLGCEDARLMLFGGAEEWREML